MPYYARGDYYRGDYYRGDPGIGSFLKKAAGFVAKAIIPSPIRAAFDVGKGIVQGFQGPATLGLPLQSGFLDTPPQIQGPSVLRAIQACAPDGKLLRGYRWNKSTYVTRGGGTSRWPQGLQVHPKGTTCVPYRRMNVANPRALRRALRRAQGFAKLARRYVAVSRKFKKGKRRR